MSARLSAKDIIFTVFLPTEVAKLPDRPHPLCIPTLRCIRNYVDLFGWGNEYLPTRPPPSPPPSSPSSSPSSLGPPPPPTSQPAAHADCIQLADLIYQIIFFLLAPLNSATLQQYFADSTTCPWPAGPSSVAALHPALPQLYSDPNLFGWLKMMLCWDLPGSFWTAFDYHDGALGLPHGTAALLLLGVLVMPNELLPVARLNLQMHSVGAMRSTLALLKVAVDRERPWLLIGSLLSLVTFNMLNPPPAVLTW